MRVLLTRPQEDAERLAARLAERGIEAMMQPMLDIVPVPDAVPDLAGVQAVLLTSANGARALAAASDERSIPVLAVGDATARAAQEAGFEAVESAAGDVDALANLARERFDPAAGALCHVAGSKVAGNLAGTLGAAGFSVNRAVLYESRTCRALASETAAALRAGTLDAVLLFSPRTAETFVSLVKDTGLADACAALTVFCLSPAVAAAAAGVPWRDVRVADVPNEDALLSLLT